MTRADEPAPDRTRRAAPAAAMAALLLISSASALRSDPQMAPADRVVDVNLATPAELQLLPSIGPALAARIVADRDANGPFASVDDLRRVSGIGERTAARLRPYATAGR